MTRPTKIIINLAALQNNLQQVRRMAPASSIIAMVKSNAYGHGIERIGRALPDAEALGVACCEEGLMLRAAGIKNPVVLMEGLFTASELDKAIKNHFILVVHHSSQIEMLEKHSGQNAISVWIKIDTGMHRLGFKPEEALGIYQRLMNCDSVKKPLGLMTHFAESDSLERAPTLRQIEIFNHVTKDLPGPRSLANSAGVIAWPSAHAEWVRPGIMLYGASPFAGHRGVEHFLEPVMTLTSELIAIHHLTKDSRVGYGGTWTCPEDMRVGVIGIGYGDGYPRHAQNGTPILVNARPCPLVGRVSMDMITVDLRTQPEAKIGDPVILWGAGLPVEVVAEYSNTTGYELLTRITQRVHVEIMQF
ncbi:MAG TPA: alanine racemase [Gammaproteobacteria bacterium]|nr:alanine racemase [Gammaproteobacteria bacterium]